MRRLFEAAARGARAPARMVWLTGAYQGPQDFIDAGFASEVRARGLALDLEIVDVELAHLGDPSVLERLHRSIVAPARAQGGELWMAGISLGGFIALDYALTHPGHVDGVCLIAPYLGSRPLIAEIAATPGLPAWQPGPLAQADEERRIWGLLRARAADAEPIYLGYGREDRFARAHALLAGALPAAAVDAVPGGHEWSTWTALWRRFLDSRFT